MTLNKAKSEMYPFVDYTWNPMGGYCGHECKYCYMDPMKRFEHIEEKYEGEPRLIEEETETDFQNLEVRRRSSLSFVPDDKPLIFVCSGNDPAFLSFEDKAKLLSYLDSTCYWLIQTKDPSSFQEVEEFISPYVIFGTTIETDSKITAERYSNSPAPGMRARGLSRVDPYYKMVSIEPIMKFHPSHLIRLVTQVAWPVDLVSIGANTRNDVDLPEPGPDKTRELIYELSHHTEVHVKANLKRILEGSA